MFGLLALFRSTIGQKVLMGVTGLMLVGFIVIHLIGNLLVYSGLRSHQCSPTVTFYSTEPTG